jgi:hypothetical protein
MRITPAGPVDPLTTLDLVEEFIGGTIASGQIGNFGWLFVGGTTATVNAEASHPGIIRRDTSATISTISYLTLRAATGLNHFLASEMFDVTWVFRLNVNDADTRVRIGLSSDPSADAPASAIYLEKILTDTQWFGVCRAASTQSRTAALATVDTGWHKIRIRRTDSATIGFTFDAGAEVTLATNVPGALGVQPSSQIFNNAAASKTLDHDFFHLKITAMVR